MAGAVRGLVVLFVTNPGLRKTEICERLPDSLPAAYTVHQFNTNTQSVSARLGGQYWQRATHLACAGRGTVVLAHKSLVDNPPGNWQKVANWIRERSHNSVRSLVVFCTDDCSATAPQHHRVHAASGQSEFEAPFAWTQLALAMLRVLFLKQKDHAGSLRGRSCGDVEAQLKRLFDHVLLLPVSRAHSSSPCLSKEREDELRRLCEEGFVRCRLQKQGSAGLPDAWEGRMRDNLNEKDVQNHVMGFSVPIEEQVQTLSRTIRRIISGQMG